MPVIGLTGSIGSGKSTVSAILAELGAVVLSADEIGHEALQPRTAAWQEVVSAFGEGILKAGGEVDRQKLGEIVFNNAGALARLNRIMHPRMYRMAEKRIEELKQQGGAVIVLEAPLLVEAGWLPLADQVWITVADEETIVHRLCQRSGLSEAQALARIRSQLPAEEKTKYADVVINTSGTLSEVEAKVKELWEALQAKMVKERIRQVLSQREKGETKNKGLAPAAVLVPIYEKAGEFYLIVTKRTEEVNYHKGQISFPGGGRQAQDKTLRDTALRESWEEIGLSPKDVEILGELDDIATVTNFVISPFVAAIPYPYEFRASPSEVEEIIEVPIAALLDKNNFKEELKFREGKFISEYSYEYQNWVIWGATARILKQFLEVVFGA
ncbi:MAG TPA: dephospho-CoA kinase [Dehalococcoidia bacterium]|nr:dephospho-CoA kinase [Dehalococcoidia bacterium]